ncbi:MAG: hydroxymethylbilane synthase [Planctomycetales bacterium]
MTDSLTTLRLGARGSALARWQADWVSARLRELDGVEVELVLISTHGDRNQTESIAAGSSQGVFTKEIQKALIDGRVDLAVHSLKDLPTDPIKELTLAAVPPRGPVQDVLVAREAESLADLPQGAVIGTGSLRRRSQLLRVRPDLQMKDVRGNVDTRLQKLKDGECDALILADAGLTRLGWKDHITERLPVDLLLPAVGQGALGIETRAGDSNTLRFVEQLNDPDSRAAVIAERSMLATLRGGCLAPVGGWARMEEEQLALSGMVAAMDGSQRLESLLRGSPEEASELGIRVAEDLIAQGAAELIQDARG